jgi:hypothetical protein
VRAIAAQKNAKIETQDRARSATSMKALRILFSSFLALVVLVAAFANEFGNMPQVKEITNGQPEDVVAFIERMVERNHWGGEEPYDKERAEQIRKAVEKARCDSLDSEEQALKRKYKGNKKVLDAIGKAKELVT